MKLDDPSECVSDVMEECDTGVCFLIKFKSGANEKYFVGIIDNADNTGYDGRFMKIKGWDEFLEADVFIIKIKMNALSLNLM